jgi:hypothetical protein
MRLADAFAVELAALGKLWRRDKDPPLQLSAPLAFFYFWPSGEPHKCIQKHRTVNVE